MNKSESPLPTDDLCQLWLQIWPSGSGEEVENVKSLTDRRQTDDGQKAIRIAHLSFQLR
jgi:hypothetical protein